LYIAKRLGGISGKIYFVVFHAFVVSGESPVMAESCSSINMRIEVRADTEPLLEEALKVFEGSCINYSNSVNAYTDGKVLLCSINGEEHQLKPIKSRQREEDSVYTKRKEPSDIELKGWFDECVKKRWGHHLVLRRFVYDMPKRNKDLDRITLRKTTPQEWKNYKDDYRRGWISGTKLVLEKLRGFIRLWSDGKKDIHSRDFVWIAATEYDRYDGKDVHIHILLNELSIVPPKKFKAIVEAFNEQMLRSSLSNKLKGFQLHASDYIRPKPFDYEQRVSYLLKDSHHNRKHVFTSKYYRHFISDSKTNVYQELL